jgi:peptidoglycan hydrolase CwlO-like protein
MSIFIYIALAFIGGFIIAWFLQYLSMGKLKKEHKSMEGLLESERLKKENAQKENLFLIQSGDTALLTTKQRLADAQKQIKEMDSDILLLQRSNEETEALLTKGSPALQEMKLKLIEANNLIARYKAQINGGK